MTDIWNTHVDVDHFQHLHARLDLFDETIFYTRYDDGKPVSCFEVAPLDLVAAFSGLPMATGLLPRNCLFYGKSGSDERVAIYLPPAVRTLAVAGGGKKKASYTIPLPPLIFVGHGRSYAVHAVKQYPGPDEGLFLAPLPNVHAGGLICQGSVEFPRATPATIHAAADLFLSSDFNHDLSNNKSQKYAGSLFRAWKELAGKDTYPLADLVASRFKLSEVIDGRA